MVVPSQELEPSVICPPPMAFRVLLLEQQLAIVKEKAAGYSCTMVYGRIVGSSPSRAEIRDLLQPTLFLDGNHILEAILIGRGIL